ncbi:MAG: S49 family peptidase [Micavibrio aeruginosavorus]|uniref:S49 family peptidase n=1 Tax=Micavibrio aeruginosavorus TaxID=349221 RepID=A0A2W5PTL1_9BACT|nr:MAG: S49 family peptidase [Micavibrio aeruginosavorus]
MTDTLFDDDRKKRLGDYLKKIPGIGDWLDPKDKVAVLRFAGVIADSSMMRRAGVNYHKFREAIPDAFEIKRARAVALIINSPGGAPAQCSLISEQIRKFSEEKNIPVFAFIEDVAASGGYWLACAGDEIYAQESSIVGSIGVISSGFGFEDFIKKHDIKRRIHTSGRDKSFLDPFVAEKADDLERLKSVQAGIHQSFKDWVIERRGERLKGPESELMEGAFWSGKDAMSKGLVDGIGHIVTILKNKYGEDVQLVDCSPEKKSFLSQFLPFSSDSKLDLGQVIEVAEEKSFWSRFGL